MATATPPNTPTPSYSEVVAFDVLLTFKEGAASSLNLQFDTDRSCARARALTEGAFMRAVLSSVRPAQVPDLVSFTSHLSDGWESAPKWVQETSGELTIDLTKKTDATKKWITFRDVFLADGSKAAKTDSGC